MKWSEFKAEVDRTINTYNETEEVKIDPSINYIDWEDPWGDGVITIDFNNDKTISIS